MSARTLADLWPELGIDERFHIMLERQSQEVVRLSAVHSDDKLARAQLMGYANAVNDFYHYVVEGHPLPEASEL